MTFYSNNKNSVDNDNVKKQEEWERIEKFQSKITKHKKKNRIQGIKNILEIAIKSGDDETISNISKEFSEKLIAIFQNNLLTEYPSLKGHVTEVFIADFNTFLTDLLSKHKDSISTLSATNMIRKSIIISMLNNDSLVSVEVVLASMRKALVTSWKLDSTLTIEILNSHKEILKIVEQKLSKDKKQTSQNKDLRELLNDIERNIGYLFDTVVDHEDTLPKSAMYIRGTESTKYDVLFGLELDIISVYINNPWLYGLIITDCLELSASRLIEISQKKETLSENIYCLIHSVYELSSTSMRKLAETNNTYLFIIFAGTLLKEAKTKLYLSDLCNNIYELVYDTALIYSYYIDDSKELSDLDPQDLIQDFIENNKEFSEKSFSPHNLITIRHKYTQEEAKNKDLLSYYKDLAKPSK